MNARFIALIALASLTLPACVVTSTESNTIEQALRTAKVSFLLLRPLQKEELISAIRQALRSAPRQDPL